MARGHLPIASALVFLVSLPFGISSCRCDSRRASSSLAAMLLSAHYQLELCRAHKGQYPETEAGEDWLPVLSAFCAQHALEMTYRKDEERGYFLIISPRTLDNPVLGSSWARDSARVHLLTPAKLCSAYVSDARLLPVVSPEGMSWKTDVDFTAGDKEQEGRTDEGE